ncbi:MAG: hypothetical protein JST70_13125 [Bacteroidetes bacterium]|nr:hypothetical protein [Bacteroidota bacterium]
MKEQVTIMPREQKALNRSQNVLVTGTDDEFGRKLQDIGLITKKRAPKT